MKPILIEKFADNGELSHYELIDSENGNLLWTQNEEDEKLITNHLRFKIRSNYGYCEYAFESDSFGEYVHIYNLYIYPQFRRNGHAKTLINKAISDIRSTGYSNEIQIVAIPEENSISKDDLISFYQRNGLRVFEQYYQV